MPKAEATLFGTAASRRASGRQQALQLDAGRGQLHAGAEKKRIEPTDPRVSVKFRKQAALIRIEWRGGSPVRDRILAGICAVRVELGSFLISRSVFLI